MRYDVRAAVRTAAEYLKSFKDLLGSFENLRLEEIELSEDRKYWLITLGFDITNQSDPDENPLFPVLEGSDRERQYKLIKIDTFSGQPQSMKIRKP
ncbi:MAG: hypothetical protein J7647_22175 [Cyanobacteria bacterium SBLK]|nr:hypothetical protein [Cyanobacteria bacterium SBLK]